MGAGSFPEDGQEAVDLPVDGTQVHHRATLGKTFRYICVAETITHIQMDSESYQIAGKVMAGEGSPGASSEASTALVAPPHLPAQSRLSIPPGRLAPARDTPHSQSLLSILD